MGRLTGGSQIIAAIFLVIVGILIQSAIFEALLDIVGIVLIIAGIVIGIIAVVGMLRGDKQSSSY